MLYWRNGTTMNRMIRMSRTNRSRQNGNRDLDVKDFENRLLLELKRLRNGFEGIKEKSFSMSQQETLGIESAYDQHPADIGTETFERGKDLGLKEGLEIGMARVRGALERIRHGKYGFCLRCKEPIPVEGLEPHLRLSYVFPVRRKKRLYLEAEGLWKNR